MRHSVPTFAARIAAALFLAAAAFADDGLPRRGMFGVQLAPVNEQNFEQLGLDKPIGILITGAFPDTPAAAAGLKANDVVLRVNETDIAVFDDFLHFAQSTRGGDEVVLKVRRGAESLDLKFKLAARPQESEEDFDIQYDALQVGDLRLRTIITKPRAAGKRPAILWVQDLGPASIDWFSPQMENPTRALLYGLTRAGIVTMRVELPGIGDSEGARADHSGFAEHAPRFAAAVRRLGHYDFVDAERVFVFGERFGSFAAPFIAAEAKPAGVGVWSAFGRPYITVQLDLSRQHQKLEAFSDDAIAQTVAGLEQVLKLVLLEGKSPRQVRDANPEHATILAQIAPNDGNFLGRSVQFFRELAKIDPTDAWRKVECDVLVLRGACDFTSCAIDTKAIADAVNSAHPGRAKLVEMAGIDGAFSKAQDMEESYLAGSPGAFNPIIVDELVRWVTGKGNAPGHE